MHFLTFFCWGIRRWDLRYRRGWFLVELIAFIYLASTFHYLHASDVSASHLIIFLIIHSCDRPYILLMYMKTHRGSETASQARLGWGWAGWYIHSAWWNMFRHGGSSLGSSSSPGHRSFKSDHLVEDVLAKLCKTIYPLADLLARPLPEESTLWSWRSISPMRTSR